MCAGRAVVVLACRTPIPVVLVLSERAQKLARVLLVTFSGGTRLCLSGPRKSLNALPTSLNLARL